MQEGKEEIQNVINSFYQATGIGATFVDPNLCIIATSPSAHMIKDFLIFGLNQIITFLSNKFREPVEENQPFYTFYLEANLVCNVSILKSNGKYLGAYISQPVLIKEISQDDVDFILKNSDLSVKEKSTLWHMISKVQVIDYARIMPVGKILHTISSATISFAEVRQELCGSDNQNIINAVDNFYQDNDNDSIIQKKRNRHIDFGIYLKIKEHIESGDPKGLMALMSNISAGAVQWEQLINSDFIRSLKNSFIKTCTMGSFCAIGAGVHYEKVMDLSDDAIRQMETLENINDIYELLRTTVVSFANLVLLDRTSTYSKPVRQIMDYITMNYTEKITLSDLSVHTNLSNSYLSNIIKKETGLSLSENVNKVRVEESKKLLINTNISILDIALQVGYQYQNHYASIFKRFTGYSPLDYRLIMGKEAALKKVNGSMNDGFPQILQQLHNRLTFFNEFYDYARIVDTESKMSWSINSESTTKPMPDMCYQFWKKKEPCSGCVSSMACIKNDIFIKLIEQKDDIFLVIGIPNLYGERKYAAEIIKKVTNQISIETDDIMQANVTSLKGIIAAFDNQINKTEHVELLYERFHNQFNRSKLNKENLSIILAHIEVMHGSITSSHGNESFIIEKFYEGIINSYRSESDWAIRYPGNIFLIVLGNTDFNTALKISERITSTFTKSFAVTDEAMECAAINYGIKSISDQVTSSDAFIKLAYLDLYSKL